jgi:RNA polymerase sigma factor (sigma-70 family)
MRATSAKGPVGTLVELPDSRRAASASPPGQLPPGAVRSWLVRGTRNLVIDPRRRRGGYAQAKQLLVEDGQSAPSNDGVWRDLVSALQRHTVLSGLAQLSHEERQVVILAYLQGRTNREIAAMLAVSVSTVRRRLSAALERLELYVRGTGGWLSSMVLLGLTLGMRHTRTAARFVTTAHTTAWPNTLAFTAAGTATVVALGLVALSPDSGAPKHPSAPATVAWNPLAPPADGSSDLPGLSPVLPDTVSSRTGQPSGANSATDSAGQSPSHTTVPADPGCDGNPTSAAPAAPVGSRTNHPTTAPVTHPTAGGCGPYGAEFP